MDDEYKFQLVIQLPGTTQQDFDVLVSIEEALADALNGTPHEVDGHDFGSGTGNIFIQGKKGTGTILFGTKFAPALFADYLTFSWSLDWRAA